MSAPSQPHTQSHRVPANLATEIVKFFHIDLDSAANSHKIRSIADFCKLKPEWNAELDLMHLFRLCSALEHAGYLMSGFTGEHDPILGRGYVSVYDERRAVYGEYEFIAGGFPRIRESFAHSVLPVEVEKEDGTPDIGTCFLLGNASTIVTARHVIENKNFVGIRSDNGQYARICGLTVPEDDSIDVAIILLESPLQSAKPFRCQNAAVLDEVLCLGYPPIPGFQTILLSDISTISAEIKSSPGRVVGMANSYLDKQEYLLINARVKGGNSGGPVVDAKGYVVGILVQASMSDTEQNKLDHLGYGVVTPLSNWRQLFANSDGIRRNVSALRFENIESGGFRTAC